MGVKLMVKCSDTIADAVWEDATVLLLRLYCLTPLIMDTGRDLEHSGSIGIQICLILVALEFDGI